MVTKKWLTCPTCHIHLDCQLLWCLVLKLLQTLFCHCCDPPLPQAHYHYHLFHCWVHLHIWSHPQQHCCHCHTILMSLSITHCIDHHSLSIFLLNTSSSLHH